MSLPKFKKAALIVLLVFLLLAFFALVLFFYFQGGASPLMAAKAFWSGYSLVYQDSYQDTVGRTVIAGKSRYTPALFDDLGGGAFQADEPAWWEGGAGLMDRIYGVGVFKEWKEIQEDEGKHLVLTGPDGKGLLQLRVVFEPRDRPFDSYRTVFCVDDLNLNIDDFEKKAEEPVFVPLGYLSDFSQQERDKLLKPGDVVGFMLRHSGSLKGSSLKGELIKDDFETPVLGMIILRRFGGRDQLEKELGRKIEVKGEQI